MTAGLQVPSIKHPGKLQPRHPLAEDVWELYNVNEDFSQANNLAEKNPEKLEELKKIFMEEAVKYNVLPIDDRSIERFDPANCRQARPDEWTNKDLNFMKVPEASLKMRSSISRILH